MYRGEYQEDLTSELEHDILKNKNSLTELKRKLMKTKTLHSAKPQNKHQPWRQNKSRTDKEIHDWKGNNIIISQEPRLEKSQASNQKDRQIIKKYPNGQQHWFMQLQN